LVGDKVWEFFKRSSGFKNDPVELASDGRKNVIARYRTSKTVNPKNHINIPFLVLLAARIPYNRAKHRR